MFNKANELQEEICVKRLELRMAQLHLAGCKAQVMSLSLMEAGHIMAPNEKSAACFIIYTSG